MKTVRLAIVDDSTFILKAITRMLEGNLYIQVVGTAASGEEMLENLARWRPDVITLDLNMPGMGGMTALSRVLEWRRIPVIILSTHSQKDTPMALEALHRGAVDFIDKQSYSLVDFAALREVLVEKILSVAAADRALPPLEPELALAPPPPLGPAIRAVLGIQAYDALVIGASTGGPPAIQSLLESLNGGVDIPIAIVQHMPEGFTRAFAERLNAHMPFPVQEARHAERFLPGRAYIGPTGSHFRLKRDGDQIFTVLTKYPEHLAHRPAVDVLFESAAQVYAKRALAVLLTGMGADGAQGMAELSAAGAYTIGQNEATCVVYGMPRAAMQIGAVREELPLGRIAVRVQELLIGQRKQ
jgi:two-component system chemotaxis response regulator CheB